MQQGALCLGLECGISEFFQSCSDLVIYRDIPGHSFFILWLLRFANDLQNASVPITLIRAFITVPVGLVLMGEQFRGNLG